MKHYEWSLVGENPQRHHLLHVVSHKPVATIEQLENGVWRWVRNTTIKLQGSPFAEGESESLESAKAAILDGLPDH